MKLKNKSVLITGSAGFIGSHLLEELVNTGSDVKCFVKYNSSNNWGFIETLPDEMKRKIELLPGDLKDPDACRDAVVDIDVIFHLGAIIAIPYSYRNPRDVIETNVLGTYNILKAALDSDVERVVHTSTSEVYGTALNVPINESHPLQGQSPYSASKIGADKIAESFHKSFGLPVSIIRPFNTYGPRQSARAVIPTIITQAMTRDEIVLGSLEPTRDFTFVKDTVLGFIKTAECDSCVGDVVNIGSGKEISIGELAEKINIMVGKGAKITSTEKRKRPEKSEVMRLCADISKANSLFGWMPKISLSEGLEKTIEWMKDNINLYKPEIYNI